MLRQVSGLYLSPNTPPTLPLKNTFWIALPAVHFFLTGSMVRVKKKKSKYQTTDDKAKILIEQGLLPGIGVRFPRAPSQSSVQIGGLNRQQYAELVKTHQSTLRTAQKEPKRIAAALKRQRKAAERKRKRGRSGRTHAEKVHRMQVPPL